MSVIQTLTHLVGKHVAVYVLAPMAFTARDAVYIGETDLIDCVIKSQDELDKALVWAAERGAFPLIRHLIETRKANPEKHGLFISTGAVYHNDLQMVRYLIEKRALQANTANSINILTRFCAELGHVDILRYFVEDRGADTHRACALQSAAANNMFPAVQYLIEHTSVNSKVRAIREASKNGQLDIIKYIIEKGDLNIYHFGDTAIYDACMNGQLSIVKYLIKLCGSFPDISNMLFYAANYGHTHIIRYIIEECDPDAYSKYPNTLITAINQNKIDTVKYLIEEAKFSVYTNDCEALREAINTSNMDMVRLLQKWL